MSMLGGEGKNTTFSGALFPSIFVFSNLELVNHKTKKSRFRLSLSLSHSHTHTHTQTLTQTFIKNTRVANIKKNIFLSSKSIYYTSRT